MDPNGNSDAPAPAGRVSEPVLPRVSLPVSNTRGTSAKRARAPRARKQYRRWCWTLHLTRDPLQDPRSGEPAGSTDHGLDSDSEGQPPPALRRLPESNSSRSEAYESLPRVRCAESDSSSSSSGEPDLRRASDLAHPPSCNGEPDVSSRPESLSKEEATTFIANLADLLRGSSRVSFYVFQLEEAPQTKRLHLQGYCRFNKPIELPGLKKLFAPFVPHFEACQGNEKQNIDYCTKPESRIDGPWQWGELGAPGKRNDIAIAREIVTTGGRLREVVEQVNSYQAMKCAELMLKYCEQERRFLPTVKWYHGATGTGKTRTASEEFPEAWISARNLKWWEGYDAHTAVIIDDFRKDFCTFHELLRILDRYPYRVETKGGSRQLLAQNIIITCPWAPDILFLNRSAEDIGQLMRRISEVKLFGSEPVDPPAEHTACAPGFRSNS